MRLSFSESEGEEKISKRYLISHSVQSQFKMAYNDDWGLVTTEAPYPHTITTGRLDNFYPALVSGSRLCFVTAMSP